MTNHSITPRQNDPAMPPDVVSHGEPFDAVLNLIKRDAPLPEDPRLAALTGAIAISRRPDDMDHLRDGDSLSRNGFHYTLSADGWTVRATGGQLARPLAYPLEGAPTQRFVVTAMLGGTQDGEPAADPYRVVPFTGPLTERMQDAIRRLTEQDFPPEIAEDLVREFGNRADVVSRAELLLLHMSYGRSQNVAAYVTTRLAPELAACVFKATPYRSVPDAELPLVKALTQAMIDLRAAVPSLDAPRQFSTDRESVVRAIREFMDNRIGRADILTDELSLFTRCLTTVWDRLGGTVSSYDLVKSTVCSVADYIGFRRERDSPYILNAFQALFNDPGFDARKLEIVNSALAKQDSQAEQVQAVVVLLLQMRSETPGLASIADKIMRTYPFLDVLSRALEAAGTDRVRVLSSLSDQVQVQAQALLDRGDFTQLCIVGYSDDTVTLTDRPPTEVEDGKSLCFVTITSLIGMEDPYIISTGSLPAQEHFPPSPRFESPAGNGHIDPWGTILPGGTTVHVDPTVILSRKPGAMFNADGQLIYPWRMTLQLPRPEDRM